MNASNPSFPGARGRSATLMSAIRGPVLMITVGVLFAVAYSGGPHFGRTWPVLLIVAGAMRLFEYLSARGERPGPYSSGSYSSASGYPSSDPPNQTGARQS